MSVRVNINKIPFLTFPGPASEAFSLTKLFDVDIIPTFPLPPPTIAIDISKHMSSYTIPTADNCF